MAASKGTTSSRDFSDLPWRPGSLFAVRDQLKCGDSWQRTAAIALDFCARLALDHPNDLKRLFARYMREKPSGPSAMQLMDWLMEDPRVPSRAFAARLVGNIFSRPFSSIEREHRNPNRTTKSKTRKRPR